MWCGKILCLFSLVTSLICFLSSIQLSRHLFPQWPVWRTHPTLMSLTQHHLISTWTPSCVRASPARICLSLGSLSPRSYRMGPSKLCRDDKNLRWMDISIKIWFQCPCRGSIKTQKTRVTQFSPLNLQYAPNVGVKRKFQGWNIHSFVISSITSTVKTRGPSSPPSL